MPQPRITRDDVTSMVGARQELGEEMEPAVVDAFLERVDAAIEARAAERRLAPLSDPGTGERLALAIVSLGTGIPITAIAASTRSRKASTTAGSISSPNSPRAPTIEVTSSRVMRGCGTR